MASKSGYSNHVVSRGSNKFKLTFKMAANTTEKATPSVSFKLSATGSSKRGASSFKRSSDIEGNEKQDKDYILSVEDKKLNRYNT